MTFGHKVPKLNGRPVYYSWLYGKLSLENDTFLWYFFCQIIMGNSLNYNILKGHIVVRFYAFFAVFLDWAKPWQGSLYKLSSVLISFLIRSMYLLLKTNVAPSICSFESSLFFNSSKIILPSSLKLNDSFNNLKIYVFEVSGFSWCSYVFLGFPCLQ